MPHYWHVSNSFASFFQSYTRAMNKVYHRTGPLFENPFKRIEVKDEVYFTRLVAYIHRNPEKHGIIDDFKTYPYSSYLAHRQDGATRLQRKELLDWFGGTKDYVAFHEQQLKAELDAEWLLED